MPWLWFSSKHCIGTNNILFGIIFFVAAKWKSAIFYPHILLHSLLCYIVAGKKSQNIVFMDLCNFAVTVINYITFDAVRSFSVHSLVNGGHRVSYG